VVLGKSKPADTLTMWAPTQYYPQMYSQAPSYYPNPTYGRSAGYEMPSEPTFISQVKSKPKVKAAPKAKPQKRGGRGSGNVWIQALSMARQDLQSAGKLRKGFVPATTGTPLHKLATQYKNEIQARRSGGATKKAKVRRAPRQHHTRR
jgi:hypothetical protein